MFCPCYLDLLRSLCFGKLTVTPHVSRTLTFDHVVNGPNFKNIIPNIDLGITPKLYEIQIMVVTHSNE